MGLHGSHLFRPERDFLKKVDSLEEEIPDFRKPSLVGSVYKILAKVLANCLKDVLGRIVSDKQNALI